MPEAKTILATKSTASSPNPVRNRKLERGADRWASSFTVCLLFGSGAAVETGTVASFGLFHLESNRLLPFPAFPTQGECDPGTEVKRQRGISESPLIMFIQEISDSGVEGEAAVGI